MEAQGPPNLNESEQVEQRCTAPHPGVSFALSLATLGAVLLITFLVWKLLR